MYVYNNCTLPHTFSTTATVCAGYWHLRVGSKHIPNTHNAEQPKFNFVSSLLVFHGPPTNHQSTSEDHYVMTEIKMTLVHGSLYRMTCIPLMRQHLGLPASWAGPLLIPRVKVKVVNHAPQESIGGAHLRLPGLEPVGGEPLVSDAWLVWRQTYGYLPSRKASPPIGWYQIILLRDRGTCVFTTCPGLHSTAERLGFEPATYWSQVRRPNHSSTEPHGDVVVGCGQLISAVLPPLVGRSTEWRCTSVIYTA